MRRLQQCFWLINYNVWALRMQHCLKREALWLYVDSPLNQLSVDDNVKDQTVVATIILSVADDQLVHISGKTKAKDVWDSLRAVYIQQKAGSLIAITQWMYRIVMWPGESVRAHLNTLAEFFQLLEHCGKTVPEEDKVYIILSSLSEEYSMLVTSMESIETSKLTLAYITGRLLEEEARHAEKKTSHTHTWIHYRPEAGKGASCSEFGGRSDNRRQAGDSQQVALSV